MAVIENPPSDLITVSSHRGLHALVDGANPLVPENSFQAIGLAAQAGLEMIELDVKLTSDGLPIMSHDQTWGRETCPTTNFIGAFNPFLAQGSNSDNDSLNTPVNEMTLATAMSSLTLRDTVSVIQANGGSSSCSADYANGQPYIYPSSLQQVLNYLTQNKIAMVLALDLRDGPAATAAWNVIASTPDYLGNSYAQSTLFKIPGKAFLNPNNPGVFTDTTVFQNTFPAVNFTNPNTGATTALNYSDVHFQPVYNTGDIAANLYGNEANIITQLKAFETNSAIDVLAVEVQFKEPGGILSNVLSAARQNWATGGLETVSVFSPYVDYYYPSDTTQTPLFFTTTGYCCVPLSAFYYGPTMANSNGPNSPNPAVPFPTVPNPNYTAGQPTDTADERGNLSFVLSQGYNSVTRDDAAQFVQLVGAAGDRNISYMQTGGPDPNCQPGVGQWPGCEADGLTTYTLCASNGGKCIFTGDRNVAYGANGIYTTLTFTNTAACNTSAFPGAAPGAGNSCYISPPISYVSYNKGNYTLAPIYCADEDQTCNFNGGSQTLPIGTSPYWAANGEYSSNYSTSLSSYQCIRSAFNSDPAPGYTKACFYILPQTYTSAHAGPQGPQGWGYCGPEGVTCPAQGRTRIAYGSAAAGEFTTMVVTGPTACDNATFGDPAPKFTKDCWVEATTAASPVTGSGTLGAGANTSGSTIRQQVAVPAYFYPPSYWSQLVDTGGFAIANVANGPNYGVDPNYTSAIAVVHESGTKVLGYVDTGYFGGTSPARTTRLNQTDTADWTTQIEQDVDAWYALYGTNGIDGIFFDDGQNVCGNSNEYVTLYTNIYNYVKQNHPGAFVIANPGTAVPACLEGIADSLLTFEGSYDCYINDSSCPAGQGYTPLNWTPVDPQKQFHIVYGIPAASLANVSALTKTNNAGLVFLTSATLASNPYGSLPSFFSTTVTDANAGGGADTTMPTAPGTLSAESVQGTTATLNWAPSTDVNGSGVVAYDIYSETGGGTWIQSVPASTAPQAILTGLTPNTNYSFYVLARTVVGATSAPSNLLSVTTTAANGSVTAPSIYVDIEAFTDDVISWIPATASTYPLAYYDIFVNGVKTLTVDASVTSADIIQLLGTVNNLANGVTPPAQQYAITMDARDTNGDVSPLSSVYDIVIPVPPATDTGCTITPSSSTVTIACIYYAPWGFHHVYIDADNKTTTGYLFTWTNPEVGADYLIENSTLNAYTGNGSTFSWTPVATITPVVTGVDNSGFTYTWTIPTSDFSVIPLGNTVQYLQDGTGYVPEEYGQVITCVSGACATP